MTDKSEQEYLVYVPPYSLSWRFPTPWIPLSLGKQCRNFLVRIVLVSDLSKFFCDKPLADADKMIWAWIMET